MLKWLFAFLVPFWLVASPCEELFKLFGISTEKSTPTEIAEMARRLWMQEGKERWQFEKRYEQLRPQVWPLFDQLGMLQEVKPSKTHYDTVLVLGALMNRVQDRVNYLIETGITFDKLVFLSGERPLLESEKSQLPGLQTESEMVEWVYRQSSLPKETPVLFIRAPMKGTQRPNTIDTLTAWLETNPLPGSCLAISNQPYVHYQGAIIKQHVPFEVETAGPAVLGDPSVDLMLDTYARELQFKLKGPVGPIGAIGPTGPIGPTVFVGPTGRRE